MKYLASAAIFSIGLSAWCQGGSLVQRASSKGHLLTNPFEKNAAAVRAGAKLYKRECSACHGKSRGGTRQAPPLALPEVYQAAPGTLFWILRNGSLTTGMPSFAHLPEVQRWQIIAFLTSVVREGPGQETRNKKPGATSQNKKSALRAAGECETKPNFRPLG